MGRYTLTLSLATALSAFGCTEGKVIGTMPGARAPLQCEATPPPRAPMRLLTNLQYDNTIFDLLGDDTRPSRDFPPENRLLGFNNNADAHQASPLLLDKYMLAAEAVAGRAAERLDQIAPCSGDEDGCGRAFISGFGARAYRRPLEQDESDALFSLFSSTRQLRGYPAAITTVLEAILQSPQFLYRVDAYPPPTPETGAVAIGSYELASRLSYFFWNTMPDAELFEAADARRLDDAQELEAQARRMLADPRSRAMVADFNRQWLNLDAIPTLAREAADVSNVPDVLSDLRTSLARFVDSAYWEEGGSFDSLFLSPTVFVNQNLAGLFGVPPPASSEFEPVALAGDRLGLLMQPAVMALYAHPDQTSPVQRGVFVREQILCNLLPAPPPNVNNTPPDPDPSATTRERFRVHTALDDCARCHKMIDPVGFGFENFDQLGRYRADENGLSIDTSGEIALLGDPELDGPFQTPAELAARIAGSQRARDCLALHWYRYAMGHGETTNDRCSIDQVKTTFRDSGGDLKELLVAITLTDAFRFRPPTEAP